MAASNTRHIFSTVDEQAVFWRESADPRTLYGGGVVVERDRVRLRGSDGRTRVIQTFPASELVALAPGGPDSIAEYPSLRLELRNGRSFVLAAVLGSAVLAELIDSLMSLLPLS